jgi:hypothetical protein
MSKMMHLTMCLLFAACALCAGEKKLMHCFAFTVIEGASDADWQAFYKATDELPGKIPGLNRIWYGKLRSPLPIYQPSREVQKELRAGAKSATGEVTFLPRQFGVCMEMDSLSTLKTYASHPAHKEWVAVYSKVRQAGTTTYDIIGQ